jgi:superfamily II DNA or RNA helicase
MELYNDQTVFVKNVRKAIGKKTKHILCQSPTGSGKTVMFSYITNSAVEKEKKVLIVTDRIELLSQTGGTIERFEHYPYYIKAGSSYIDRDRDIYIAMSQTLRNRIKLEDWIDFISNEIDLVIIDEAHMQEFNYLFESKILDDKIVLGFTATPHRTGKMRQLGLDYQKIVHGTPIKELIKMKRLVNCDIYDCGSPDLSGVSMNYAKGDYSEKDMFNKFDSSKLYKGLVKNYKKHTPGQKMIVFCCNVEHAIKTTIELNNSGINARFVCAAKGAPKKPKGENPVKKVLYEEKLKSYNLYKENLNQYSGKRDEIFKAFYNTEFDVLVNVDIATKGYDCPDIEVVALYRATLSLTLYLQMIGRASRTSKGKSHFTMFDFGGNKERFGSYDAERNWALWHEEAKEGGVPPLKECGIDSKMKKIKAGGTVKEGCKRLILASTKICPFCGFKYPERDEAAEIELILAEIVDEKGVSLKNKAFKDMTFEELHKYREVKRHQMPWLWRILWNREGEKTIKQFARKYHWGEAQVQRAVSYCEFAYK